MAKPLSPQKKKYINIDAQINSMRKWSLILLLAGLFQACSDSGSGKNTPAPAPTPAPVAETPKPSGPPARVAGVFKGNLPCADCKEIEAILEIKDNQYNYNFLRKGAVEKAKMLGHRAGYCTFENGLVKLVDSGAVREQFLILSEDSIRFTNPAPKAKENKVYVLVKKKR